MSKFSSDSDESSGEKRRRKSKPSKSKVRSRSSSSSSGSHYSSHKRLSKRKRTDRRRTRSHSKTRHTSSSKSSHRARTSDGTHSRSSSKSLCSKRSQAKSKEKSRRRSRSYNRKSRSRSTEKLKLKSKSSSESSSSSESQLLHKAHAMKQEPSTQQQLQAKLQKAIKAAQTADNQLRQQGLLPIGATIRSVNDAVEPPLAEPLPSVLDEINDSSFVPKQFISAKSNLRNASIPEHAIVDLSGDLQVAPVNLDEPENILHASLFVDPAQKMDKWVKKLFHLRQKAINGEPMVITIS